MSSPQNKKKDSDVEMGEANPVLPVPAAHEATPSFVSRFLSFKERLSRRSADKEANMIQVFWASSGLPFWPFGE
ncbi:hypothetical protein Bca101_043826 [Brassica carinata]